MPITLVTGLPGHGKTLYAITKVKELSEKTNRPVYYHGINDLQLAWQHLDDPKQWNTLPEGSIIFIDECQDLFPVHETKLASLEYVLQLAKHRHRGYDIWLISQHPMNIHAFVRRLIDTHFHTIRAFGMAASNFHEWNRVVDYPEKQKKDGQTKIFKYPSDSYKYYKSAEVHTIQRKIPKKVLLILILPLLIAGLGYMAYTKLNPKHQRELIEGKVQKSSIEPTKNTLQPIQPDKKELTYVQLHTPEIPDLPFTAPVYKEIVKPTIAPFPAACIVMHNDCRCYTQQGTKLQTSHDVCIQIVKTGFFIDWQQPQPIGQSNGQVVQPIQSGVSGAIAPDAKPTQIQPINTVIPRHTLNSPSQIIPRAL